ncbi:MAG TPA: HDIG domain-containing protein [Candidatus Fimimonas merdipullorum]|uniref:HDIG domain-containing protein n=1 Tax=Candidatus Fimimonas merdipullorum TaxID=2840822 RepID=A0A9D1MWB4_9BACT|nr:HDIG domain-containing protein [Candidatus Fimimonas merdipullorum]
MAKKLNQITNIKWKEIVACYVMAFFVFSAIAIGANWQAAQEDSGVRIGVQLAATALLLVSLALYCYFADRKTMEALRNTVAMFVTMLVNYVMIYLLAFWDTYGVYLAPFALTSLIMSLIVSGKSGFFANFVLVMLYFMQSINWQMNATVGTENYFYIMFGGVVQMVFASYILGKDYRHLRYVVVGLCLGIIAALCTGISFIMFNDQWNWAVLGIKAACAFASGMIGVMLMFVLVPLFEKLFKVTSVFRFSEIATSDNELMRKLFEKAPGTYNHSLTVATYVEACAMAIGQSAVTARAAAYYHDVGKMKNPSYFSENQLGGVNPHDSMTPEASVNMIKLHTVNGLAIAKEYDLPKEVQAAIMEHHGTMPLKYFYLKAKKYTDGDLPYDGYCYDGPKPTSKISAILMICDASEAALRSSGDKSKAEKIVDDIVSERLAFEQFSDCDITMKEIDIIKSTIITTYMGIRHKRVKYPDVKLTGDK